MARDVCRSQARVGLSQNAEPSSSWQDKRVTFVIHGEEYRFEPEIALAFGNLLAKYARFAKLNGRS